MAFIQSTEHQRNTVYSAFGLGILVVHGPFLSAMKQVEAFSMGKIRNCYAIERFIVLRIFRKDLVNYNTFQTCR